jgi:hypothetical protein
MPCAVDRAVHAAATTALATPHILQLEMKTSGELTATSLTRPAPRPLRC